jgi:hypothetical protein
MMSDHRDGHDRFDLPPEDLLAEFGSWAADHGLEVDLFVVDAVLDAAEGHPGRWTAGDVRELLIEWFPRKVTMSESEWPGVISTLHGWVDFLADRHPKRSGDRTASHAEIDRDTQAFLAAMADERNYGVAKFWGTRMVENGVDTDNLDQVNHFLVKAQNGEIDYDQGVLAEIMKRGSFDAEIGAFEFEDDEDRRLPPVQLPPTEELTALAASSVLVTRLRAFVTWVGTGRTVTTTRRLRVADAKDLAGLLDLDSPYLERARSSADLPEVSLLVEWARAAHLVRVVKGKLVGIKSAAGLLDRPLDLWRRAFDSFTELGPAVCVPTSYYEGRSLLGQLLPEVASALWLSLYTAGGTPVPVEMLVEITRDTMAEPLTVGIGSLIVDVREPLWRRDLTAVLAAMELLGAIELAESTDPAERDRLVELSGNDDPDPTQVWLTPLGLWGVREALREEGFDVPLIEDLADEPVDVMCAALMDGAPEMVGTVLTAWIAARGENAAAAELAAFCVDTASSSARLTAMNGLAHAGAAGLEQARRLRAAGGLAGAVATAWLIQQSALAQDEANEQELLLALADNLAVMGEHDVLIDELATHPTDDQIGFIRALASTDHPDRLGLLETIATEHPDPTVVTAARKAVNGRSPRRGPRGKGRR